MIEKGPVDPLRCVGLLRRLAAIFYDLLLLAALWMLVTAVFLPLNGGEALDRESLLFQLYRIVLFLTALLFFVGFWLRGGQTLGMRAWHFKVIRNDGASLHLSDSLRRAGSTLLSLAPAGLGFLWALIDGDKLAWHDRLSGTRLVRVT